jgi:hypothetical protein
MEHPLWRGKFPPKCREAVSAPVCLKTTTELSLVNCPRQYYTKYYMRVMHYCSV